MSVATDYYHVFISPIPTIYLQLKYPNRSYLLLYINQRTGIQLQLNIGPFDYFTRYTTSRR